MKQKIHYTLLLLITLLVLTGCKRNRHRERTPYDTNKEIAPANSEPEQPKAVPPSNATKANPSTAKETDSTFVNAEFPGGMARFNQMFVSRYKTPEIDDTKVQIIVTFTVEKDGSLKDIKILKDPGYGAGEEAIRVLKALPKWKPATKEGVTIASQFTLPITIQIQ